MNYLLNTSGGKVLRERRKTAVKCAQQTQRKEKPGEAGRKMFLGSIRAHKKLYQFHSLLFESIALSACSWGAGIKESPKWHMINMGFGSAGLSSQS